jgi:hypothetical protein
MQTNTLQADLQQEVLDKLNRVLDLVLNTAEAASAENNHKVVIQAAREVTRIATLITKMTSPKTKSAPGFPARKPGKPSASAPRPTAADQSEKPDIQPEDFILPDIATIFPPQAVASWDPATQDIFKDIVRNYQELQTIGAEMAAGLIDSGQTEEYKDCS